MQTANNLSYIKNIFSNQGNIFIESNKIVQTFFSQLISQFIVDYSDELALILDPILLKNTSWFVRNSFLEV